VQKDVESYCPVAGEINGHVLTVNTSVNISPKYHEVFPTLKGGSLFELELLTACNSNPFKWVWLIPEGKETIERLMIKVKSFNLDHHYAVKRLRSKVGVKYNG
jgi:hypothetical protein